MADTFRPEHRARGASPEGIAPRVVDVAEDTRATLWGPDVAERTVLACHGGLDGLDDLVRGRAERLAAMGIAVVAPHYRGEADEPGRRRVGVSDVEDVLATVIWLRSEGRQVDVLWGNSRGGLVALLALPPLAEAEMTPELLVLTAPIDSLEFLYRIMSQRGHPVVAEIESVVGGSPTQAPKAYESFDGAEVLLDPGICVAVFHAQDDPVVPVERSHHLVERLRAHGALTWVGYPAAGGHRVAEAEPSTAELVLSCLAGETDRLADLQGPVV